MTTPADERARLRAAAEELESARGAYWNGKRSREKELAYTRAVDAFQAAANDDAVLRLLDDVATAEQERDACRRSSENRWNTAAELTRALNAERARAERLAAALKFYAERNHMYGSMADDWEDCSDQEAAGWLFPPDPVSDESWGVETGLVARAALDAARAGEV